MHPLSLQICVWGRTDNLSLLSSRCPEEFRSIRIPSGFELPRTGKSIPCYPLRNSLFGFARIEQKIARTPMNTGENRLGTPSQSKNSLYFSLLSGICRWRAVRTRLHPPPLSPIRSVIYQEDSNSWYPFGQIRENSAPKGTREKFSLPHVAC
jgi:hypothetical protein